MRFINIFIAKRLKNPNFPSESNRYFEGKDKNAANNLVVRCTYDNPHDGHISLTYPETEVPIKIFIKMWKSGKKNMLSQFKSYFAEKAIAIKFTHYIKFPKFTMKRLLTHLTKNITANLETSPLNWNI